MNHLLYCSSQTYIFFTACFVVGHLFTKRKVAYLWLHKQLYCLHRAKRMTEKKYLLARLKDRWKNISRVYNSYQFYLDNEADHKFCNQHFICMVLGNLHRCESYIPSIELFHDNLSVTIKSRVAI